MASPTLIAASIVSLTVAAVYAFVGYRISSRRNVSPPAQRAVLFFSVWWYGLAANIGLGGALYFAAGFGFTDFGLQLTYAYLQRLLLAVSLVGLLYYLIYLLTGKDLLLAIGAYYGAFYMLLTYSLARGEPTGVLVGSWRVDLVYAAAPEPILRLVNFAMLVLPPVIGSLLYFRLFFKVKERRQRYRIALVSWGLAVWWVVAVVAGQREAQGSEAFQLANRLFGLFVALVILAAYVPPAWVERRLAKHEDATAA